MLKLDVKRSLTRNWRVIIYVYVWMWGCVHFYFLLHNMNF